jgi:hypothetical protein
MTLRTMRHLRLAAASLIIVVLSVGAWAAVYAYDQGFTKKWRSLIMAEFERRGIEAEIGKLTIDPIEGLVARDVKIFADERRESVFASINNITLDIDIAKLLRKQQFLNTIEFRDADISFPIDPENPANGRLEIKDFSARVQIPENKIEIEHAECNFHGIHVTLVGSLLQPDPASLSGKSSEDFEKQLELMRQRRAMFARVVTELSKFHFDPNAAPHLHVELIGDLGDAKTLEATAHLSGNNVGRGNYYCDHLELRAEYHYPDILIDQVKIEDEFGEFYADARWRIGATEIPFNLESSIDSHTLMRSLFETNSLGEVVFFDPPRLGAKGVVLLEREPGSPGLPVRMTGTFECDRFASRGQIFEGAYADFSVAPDRWYVRNFLLEHKTGTSGANALYTEADGIRFEAAIEMDPTTFIPFFDKEQTKAFLRRFEFGRSPAISVQISGDGPDLNQLGWTTRGRFTLGPCIYREIPVVAATGKFEIKAKDMTFREFRIEREEGHIDGDLVIVRGAEKLVIVEGVTGRAFPAATAAYFAPKTSKALSRYKFLTPPLVTLNGTIDSGGKFRSKLVSTFKASGPATFPLFNRELPVHSPYGTVTIDGTELGLDIKTKLLGGEIEYRGNVGLGPRRGNFDGEFAANDIDFGQLAALYEIPTESRGTLGGTLKFTVPAEDKKRWSGKGAATLVDGDVFAIPIMGPISRLISGVLDKPKAGYSVATEASANFDIDRGVIRSKNFKALTPGFALQAAGQIDTVAKILDIDAEMNARGPLQIVGWPLSKLLRYKGEGPLSDPTWRPVNFTLPRRRDADGKMLPTEAPKITQIIPAAVGAGTKATIGLGTKTLQTGVKVIEIGAKSAIELGSKARDLIPIPRLFPRREKKDVPPAADDSKPARPRGPRRTPGR